MNPILLGSLNLIIYFIIAVAVVYLIVEGRRIHENRTNQLDKRTS